jgi:hypothetical protein
MLLGSQLFNPIRQQAVPVFPNVGSSLGEVQEPFVLRPSA